MSEHITAIPQNGLPEDEVFRQMDSYRVGDADWRQAKTWSLVYHYSDEHTDFLKRAYGKFFTENVLNPMAFKSLKRMETEVVKMCASLFNGGPDTVGTLTSGGSESLFLAVKSARDRARKLRPLVRKPEMLAPESAHVALEKACHYLGVKYVAIPLAEDKRVDMEALKKRINRNTILVIGSAPQYPHGVIDPIAEMGEICAAKDIPLHVDSCIGGFVLPFMEQIGRPVPLFDFRVKGVTSLSADLHKYGYTAKGCSVMLYRDMSYLKYQFFVSSIWPGGLFGSPSVPGTRPGGSIAAAWAALNKIGMKGYQENVRKAMEVTDRLIAGIEAIPELKIISKPAMTLVAYVSRDPKISIFAIGDQLAAKGWFIDRQQRPASLHCTVTAHHATVLEQYLSDLRTAVAHVKAHPELADQGEAAMYGMAAKIPMRGLVNVQIQKVMEKMYSGKDQPITLDDPSSDTDETGGPTAPKRRGWRRLIPWSA